MSMQDSIKLYSLLLEHQSIKYKDLQEKYFGGVEVGYFEGRKLYLALDDLKNMGVISWLCGEINVTAKGMFSLRSYIDTLSSLNTFEDNEDGEYMDDDEYMSWVI